MTFILSRDKRLYGNVSRLDFYSSWLGARRRFTFLRLSGNAIKSKSLAILSWEGVTVFL